MGLIADQSHLTVTDAEFETQRRRTWPGMAHFAGTGPKQTTCRECLRWGVPGDDPGYYARTGKHHGEVKPRPCSKYRELMNGSIGPAVPPTAGSCKYFELNREPPKLSDRKWESA